MAANPGVISISRKNTDHKREEVGNFFKVFFLITETNGGGVFF